MFPCSARAPKLIKKDKGNLPACKEQLIPRSCEALYPAGFF